MICLCLSFMYVYDPLLSFEHCVPISCLRFKLVNILLANYSFIGSILPAI
jgi:hypothetical protein